MDGRSLDKLFVRVILYLCKKLYKIYSNYYFILKLLQKYIDSTFKVRKLIDETSY